MQKVAVTLPVYKNDKVPYIHLSFDSILNQTYNLCWSGWPCW